MIFWQEKIDNFDPYSVLLSIATNIPQQLKTGVMIQGHIYETKWWMLFLVNQHKAQFDYFLENQIAFIV